MIIVELEKEEKIIMKILILNQFDQMQQLLLDIHIHLVLQWHQVTCHDLQIHLVHHVYLKHQLLQKLRTNLIRNGEEQMMNHMNQIHQ